MKLPIVTRSYCAIILFLATGMLSACASRGPIVGADQLIIDRISSDHVNFGEIYARETDKGIDVVGKATFTKSMMGVPPDHIAVTIIDPNGKVLYTARARYYRYGKPTKEANTFSFSLSIPLTAPKGSSVKLENDAALHRSSTAKLFSMRETLRRLRNARHQTSNEIVNIGKLPTTISIASIM
jgi:hypothetical protein